MSDEQTRAWRAAFCYWAGDTLLAAVCSAAGGPVGLLLYLPAVFFVGIIAACLAFVAGLAVAAVVRAAVGRVRHLTIWMVWWVVFGAMAGTAWCWAEHDVSTEWSRHFRLPWYHGPDAGP